MAKTKKAKRAPKKDKDKEQRPGTGFVAHGAEELPSRHS